MRQWLKTNQFLKICLLCVNAEKFTSINAACDQSEPSKPLGCDWSHASFIDVKFSTLKQNNQIFKNDFVTTVKFQLKLSCEKFLSKRKKLTSSNFICGVVYSCLYCAGSRLHPLTLSHVEHIITIFSVVSLELMHNANSCVKQMNGANTCKLHNDHCEAHYDAPQESQDQSRWSQHFLSG